jgi:hypothetical protein
LVSQIITAIKNVIKAFLPNALQSSGAAPVSMLLLVKLNRKAVIIKIPKRRMR